VDANAKGLRTALTAEYPGRVANFKVVPGDCNLTVPAVLTRLADLNWAPTFAFLDQQSTEVRWPTIEQLARHKRPGTTKTELWLLCASDGTGSFAQEESPAPAPPGQARRRRYPWPVRHDRRRPTTRARKSRFPDPVPADAAPAAIPPTPLTRRSCRRGGLHRCCRIPAGSQADRGNPARSLNGCQQPPSPSHAQPH
jgi:hypothetical protein